MKERQEGWGGGERLYGPVRDARKTRRERRGPVFRGGWKNICIHPRPPSLSPLSPISAARFLDIGSAASPYSEVSPAEATFVPSLCFFLSLHSIPCPYPYPSLSPPVSFISTRAPVSLSSSSSSCLRSSFSFSHEDDSHSLALFFSLAQCASENMNPSSHCLRQRFSNFPPLCANDEGTKGEIKSHPQ